ncbi:MAG: prohibitin family protein [Candidatus Edwardsbacteria bacterium]|nr:prohibitin family protein [Candidatus Edwardsbacteria bacterium]MBU1575640.1 prohibitin family protein [Candidatus Edwardsbacteria bacterium]MBU2462814.1 prohibitin family protein [Candidatus Edwardsbacteria bacterium]MBU2593970.1 prohibitin family protein [Candidatus Edwardsbacteria bacterium]
MFFIFTLIIAFAAGFMWYSAGEKTKQFNEAFAKNKAVSGIVAVFFLIIAILQMLTVIPAGHVGVVDFFGHVSAKTLKAGINLRNPLARIIKMSIKTQELTEDMPVPSKEGLTVQLDVTTLFHLDPEKAAEIYQTVGADYVNIILAPQFRSVCRGVTANYEAKALYTAQRELLAKAIQVELNSLVNDRGIIIESVPLRRVGLPKKVTDAIEDKLKAEQESQRMEWILTKEKQEAERKRIEAKGISDFQNIVAKGISEPLLRWKGIEATEKLASSANTKVVIIGAGKDGLPIILDTK